MIFRIFENSDIDMAKFTTTIFYVPVPQYKTFRILIKSDYLSGELLFKCCWMLYSGINRAD